MPRLTPLLLSVLALAGAAACAPGPRMSDVQTSAGSSAQGLVPTLQVATRGDSVHFTLQVTNAGLSPAALTFPSGQSFDFVVQQEGRELWRWSAERMFTQAVRQETLAPGETRRYEAVWAPPAGVVGEFTVTGTLTTSDRATAQAVRFRLP